MAASSTVDEEVLAGSSGDAAHEPPKKVQCTDGNAVDSGLLTTMKVQIDNKKQGLDASAQFDKLDADGSGDLSAAELEQFKQLRAVGTVDV